MLFIEDLIKTYRPHFELTIPELRLQPGETVALCGNNGAGKTTLLRLILDLIKADSGSVFINGGAVQGHTGWKTLTASYLDESWLITFLTPWEYFSFLMQVSGKESSEWKSDLDSFEGFIPEEILFGSRYIRDLSAGNRKKVGLVGALLRQPKLLILDEPFASLDPGSKNAFEKILLRENRERGTTHFISSHNLENVLATSGRFILMEEGRILYDQPGNAGSVQDLNHYFNEGILA